MNKKILVLMAVISLLIVGCSQAGKSDGGSSGAASDYPKKAIELIVPYPPGGGTDLIGRSLTKHIQKHLPNGQTMTVINKPGGSGLVGTSDFLKAKPDGYEILMAPVSLLTNSPLHQETVFEYESFVPLVKVATARQTLLVQENSPLESYEDWLKYVQENPGEFTYGVTGTTSVPHLAMEMLSSEVNVQTKNVAFEGAGPAKTALLGGHVQGVVAPINTADRGELRALFSFSDEKGELTEGIPLLKEEQGINIGLDVVQGIFMPKETPDEILQILQDAFKNTMEDPEFIEEFKKTELDLTYADSETFQKELDLEREKLEGVLKQLGLLKNPIQK